MNSLDEIKLWIIDESKYGATTFAKPAFSITTLTLEFKIRHLTCTTLSITTSNITTISISIKNDTDNNDIFSTVCR